MVLFYAVLGGDLIHQFSLHKALFVKIVSFIYFNGFLKKDVHGVIFLVLFPSIKILLMPLKIEWYNRQ